MIKRTKIYQDDDTGITLKVKNGKVTITPGTQTIRGGTNFIFSNSDPNIVIKVCNSIVRLIKHVGEFSNEL